MPSSTEQFPGRAARALNVLMPITRFAKVLGGIFSAIKLCNSTQAQSATASTGQSVTLAWSAGTDTNVVGYNVYYGESGGDYTNEICGDTETNATISGLLPGATYYFAVTTYDSLGDESGFSSEVTYTVPAPTPAVQISVTATGQFVL